MEQYDSDNSESDGSEVSPIIVSSAGRSHLRLIDQNQINEQEIKQSNNMISTSYTEPLGLNKLLELNYAYTNNLNISENET